MRKLLLAIGGLVALSSCAIDEYHYGYAPAYRTLPPGFVEARIDGSSYWHHGGRFYRKHPKRGFLLVRPPKAQAKVAWPDATAPSPPVPIRPTNIGKQ